LSAIPAFQSRQYPTCIDLRCAGRRRLTNEFWFRSRRACVDDRRSWISKTATKPVMPSSFWKCPRFSFT